MDGFFSPDHLSLILAYIVPGFIILSVRSQFITDKAMPDNKERFLSYVTISAIYGTLVLRLVDATLYQDSTWVFLLVLFGGPVCLGLLFGINIQKDLVRRFLNRLGLFPLHPSPTSLGLEIQPPGRTVGAGDSEEWRHYNRLLRKGVLLGVHA